jgi:hypothetical protein
MRRSSTPKTFGQVLSDEKARIEAQLEETEPGPLQDALRRKLERIETASRNEKWITSKGLQPPK